jgi:4'-phosphopantetheinyl transferase
MACLSLDMQVHQQMRNTSDSISTQQVDLWRIDLASEAHEARAYRSFLSDDEIQRADKFRFGHSRDHFIIARAVMRTILAGYVDLEPRQLVFSYGRKGKPELRFNGPGPALKFNLSHSRDFALLAVTKGARIGVDIEFVNPKIAASGLAARFFAPGEVHALDGVATSLKAEAFFACWTRKEAYLKALGTGLSLALDGFEVTLKPGLPALLLTPDPHDSTRWGMYDLDAPAGYKAAVVVEGDRHQLRQLCCPSEGLSTIDFQPVNASCDRADSLQNPATRGNA